MDARFPAVADYTLKEAGELLDRIAGGSSERIGVRQLERWDLQRALSPSVGRADGSGSRRRYSYKDLVALRTVALIADERRVSLERLRLIAKAVAAHDHGWPRYWLHSHPPYTVWLIEQDPALRQTGIYVDLGHVHAELQAALR